MRYHNFIILAAAKLRRAGTKPKHKHRLIATQLCSYCSRIVALFVFSQVIGFALLLSTPSLAIAQTRFNSLNQSDTNPVLVIGFVGGFVHSDDMRHSEVQLARQLQESYGSSVQVRMFENRHIAQAHHSIIGWLNSSDNNSVTDGRGPQPRIILFGHSWGASAVVSLARQLEQDGIAVALTVQVDSVAKGGRDDSVVPANVAEAVNFYQTSGIVHGRSRITAADPSRTAILGNFRFKYDKRPVECRTYPWYDRLLFKGHTAIECDPRVWSQVEMLVRMRLPAAPNPQTETARLGK